jgi:hypothetical protein
MSFSSYLETRAESQLPSGPWSVRWACLVTAFCLTLFAQAAKPVTVSFGTGFAVQEDGYVVTSGHVVRGAETITLHSSSSGQNFKAKLIAKDDANDLALLKVEGVRFVPLKFSDFATIPTGLEIFAFGFPQPKVQGQKLKISSGLINAREGFEGALGRFQFSAEIQRGHSGGPVIAKDGTVVGMIHGKLAQKTLSGQPSMDLPQNVNFGIESTLILDFLGKHGVRPSHAPLNARLERPSFLIFDDVSPSVYFIEVSLNDAPSPTFSAKDISAEAKKVLQRLDAADRGRLLGALKEGFREVLDSKLETLLLEEPTLRGTPSGGGIRFRSIVSFEEEKKHQKGFVYKSVILVSSYDCQNGRPRPELLEYKDERFGGGKTLMKLKRSIRRDTTGPEKTEMPKRLKTFLDSHLCVKTER